jgi:SPOR domain
MISVVWPIGLCAPATPAAAQSKTKTRPSAPDGRKTVIEGIKAYEAGHLDKAVELLSKAVTTGGLPSNELAKALYYRGLAYQRSDQPAQAIADLTNAIWMKEGLTQEERQEALDSRGKAYASVGVKDPGPPAVRVGTASPIASAPAPQAATAPAVAPAPKAPSPPVASNKPAKIAKSPSPGAAKPLPGFQTKVSTATSPPAATSSEPNAASGSGSPLSGVGSFFSNLFSGGSDESEVKATASSPTATATIGIPKPSSSVTAVSEWSSKTSLAEPASRVAVAAPTQRTAVAAPTQRTVVAAPPQTNAVAAPKAKTRSAAVQVASVSSVPRSPPPAKTKAPPKGNIRLQVAAVRSRNEAERVAAELTRKHGSQIGARAPAISETVYGNMGTFYQVNVGPFARTTDTADICRTLKADGYDCLVVDQ